MAERFKAHAWKVCVPSQVPWVRIPLSPPLISIFFFNYFLNYFKAESTLNIKVNLTIYYKFYLLILIILLQKMIYFLFP